MLYALEIESFSRLSIGKPIIVYFLKCQHLFCCGTGNRRPVLDKRRGAEDINGRGRLIITKHCKT